MRSRSLSFLILVLLGTAPVIGHHSLSAAYDTGKTVSLTGAIAKVAFRNPHAQIYLDVKETDGRVETWLIEMAGPNALTRRGVDLKLLAAGQQITVESWLARNGQKQANGRTVITADGSRLDVRDNWPDMVFPGKSTK
jgi:hypothetical protein